MCVHVCICIYIYKNVYLQDGYLRKFLNFSSLQHPFPSAQGWKLARGEPKTEPLFGEEPRCSLSG